MKYLGFIFILILWIGIGVAQATFVPILADTFDEYGVQNPVPTKLGPYLINTYNSQYQIKCTSGIPWRSGTGCYLEASSGNAGNPGPGAYAYFGNPCQTPAYVGWVRFVSGTGSGNYVGFLRFDNTVNYRSGPPPGLTDLEWLGLGGSGPYTININNSGGTFAGSASGIPANQWLLMGWFVRHGIQNGTSVTQGATQLQINGSIVVNNTNVNTTNASYVIGIDTLVLDDEFSTNAVIDWGPYMLGCVASASDMPVALYAVTQFPTGNGTPLQWTPSAGSNFSNVNGVPPGANYNYANSLGYQDIYSLPYQSFFTPFLAMVGQQSETDSGLGSRVGIIISKSASGTITNGGLGIAAQTNSGYQFYEWPVPYSAGMSIGMQVQN
jgi:hypothetical protein